MRKLLWGIDILCPIFKTSGKNAVATDRPLVTPEIKQILPKRPITHLRHLMFQLNPGDYCLLYRDADCSYIVQTQSRKNPDLSVLFASYVTFLF